MPPVAPPVCFVGLVDLEPVGAELRRGELVDLVAVLEVEDLQRVPPTAGAELQLALAVVPLEAVGAVDLGVRRGPLVVAAGRDLELAVDRRSGLEGALGVVLVAESAAGTARPGDVERPDLELAATVTAPEGVAVDSLGSGGIGVEADRGNRFAIALDLRPGTERRDAGIVDLHVDPDARLGPSLVDHDARNVDLLDVDWPCGLAGRACEVAGRLGRIGRGRAGQALGVVAGGREAAAGQHQRGGGGAHRGGACES